jgi:DNA mismatch repair protein MutS
MPQMKMTPMLRQYLELKDQAGDALLLYRMGDFYELFFEDAKVAAPVLGIALTRRRHNDDVEAPMCGVPHHALDSYLGKLLKAGYRVALAEQVEDPAKAKGLVRREIVRVHTPGTISDSELLDGERHCFLAAIGGDSSSPAVAWLEVSTGTFEGMRCANGAELSDHLATLEPRELLVVEGWNEWRSMWPAELALPTITPLSAESFSPAAGEKRLRRVLEVASLRGFGLSPGEPLVGIAGALLAYAESTQRCDLKHLRKLVTKDRRDALIVDRASLRNLEVERAADGSRNGSLLAVLDHCTTRMGSRLLRDWLVQPSVDQQEISDRHRAVAELVDDPDLLEEIRGSMKGLPDLARLAARLGLGQAGPRELHALRAGLDLLPGVRAAADGSASPLLRRLATGLDVLQDVASMLHSRLAEDPPAVVGNGAIRGGWDAQLDEQRTLARGGKELLAGIERTERERTGISSLKVRYNKVFGYYIEVSKSYLDRIPDSYERRQTLTNAERFVTDELKRLESRILSAEEQALARERQLYAELIAELGPEAARLATSAAQVAQLDVLSAFADRARLRGYCRPVVDGSGGLMIRDGRHPVLEEVQRDPQFVPNDCELDPESCRIILLTGPNMGGKSTFLRQVALITIMAHAGSFVPASEATIGLTDRVFTRVGASDLLARGESTFMVEMTETANILHHATPRSLVILDEVGRGTATFDGLSLAWAIVEHLHTSAEHAAKVLFATHYHELTDLARRLPFLVNRSMAVKEWKGTILFLHRVTAGPADHSYGIHVARLAGVPGQVCQRAEEILDRLERHELNLLEEPQPEHDPVEVAAARQLTLFRPASEEILERLRRLDMNATTPLEALNLVAQLKELADG